MSAAFGRDDMRAWSPDGRKIAFVHSDLSGLNILDLRAGRIRRVAGTSGSWLGYQAWSPDGRRLALTGSRAVTHRSIRSSSESVATSMDPNSGRSRHGRPEPGGES